MTQSEGRRRREATCPCGSGKLQRKCCGWGGPRGKRIRTVGTVALILVVGSAVAAMTLKGGDETVVGTPAAPAAAAPATGTGTGSPAPYEYDPVSNRHWDPAHGHWHDGPPPGYTAPPGALTQRQEQIPRPWEFDPQTNKHWDPEHGHWHDGPPPPDKVPFRPTPP